MKIELTTNPKPEEAEIKFYVLAKNTANAVIGGIRAICYWNTLHIELFWMNESHRGTGKGKALLFAAEKFARENNCEKVLVETTSWQAKPFYENQGYILMATLKGRPKGFASFYLTKEL